MANRVRSQPTPNLFTHQITRNIPNDKPLVGQGVKSKAQKSARLVAGTLVSEPLVSGTLVPDTGPTKAESKAEPKAGLKAEPKQANAPAPKLGFTRLQVYLTRAEVGSALQREATARRMSLSQAASAMIERGLRGKIEPDADNRLLTLERRLSDHMRTSSRDLMIIEEMIFSTLKVLMTRFPQDVSLEDPTYQAAIDAKMSTILDEVARRIGTQNLVRAQGLADADTKSHEDPNTISILNVPLPISANDSSKSNAVSVRAITLPKAPPPAPPTNLEMDF
jgi:hypothetical protein